MTVLEQLEKNGWYNIGTAKGLGISAEPGCLILGKQFDRLIYNPKTDKIVGKYQLNPPSF